MFRSKKKGGKKESGKESRDCHWKRAGRALAPFIRHRLRNRLVSPKRKKGKGEKGKRDRGGEEGDIMKKKRVGDRSAVLDKRN